MRIVNINFLRAGQIVADAVKNPQGAVLCPMGFTLTDQAIERLRNARVQMVAIEGSSEPPFDIQASIVALENRFAGVTDPVLLEIKALVDRRYRHLAEEYKL